MRTFYHKAGTGGIVLRLLQVEQIVANEAEAAKLSNINVKNPPKVRPASCFATLVDRLSHTALQVIFSDQVSRPTCLAGLRN